MKEFSRIRARMNLSKTGFSTIIMANFRTSEQGCRESRHRVASSAANLQTTLACAFTTDARIFSTDKRILTTAKRVFQMEKIMYVYCRRMRDRFMKTSLGVPRRMTDLKGGVDGAEHAR